MLNSEQLAALRMAPLTGANKVSLALELVGLKQIEIAAALGVTQSLVSKVARGELSKLPIETARKFAAFFGCSMEDLFPARERNEVAS